MKNILREDDIETLQSVQTSKAYSFLKYNKVDWKEVGYAAEEIITTAMIVMAFVCIVTMFISTVVHSSTLA